MINKCEKKFFAGLTAAVCSFALLCIGAAASEPSAAQVGDSTIRLSGTEIQPGTVITVNLLPGGKTYDDLRGAENKAEILLYHGQVAADENGGFSVDMTIGNTGEYTVYYKVGNNDVKSAPVKYVNILGEVERLQNVISDSQKTEQEKIAEIKAFLTNADYAEPIGLDKKDYTADDETVAKYFYNTAKKTPIIRDGADVTTEVIRIYRRCVGMAAFAGGVLPDIYGDADYFDLKNSDIANWYGQKCVTESVRNAAAKRIAAFKPQSEDEFETAVRDALILSVVEKPDGAGIVKEIMDDFADVIGITPEASLTRYSTNAAGKSFDTLPELKEAYNTPLKNNGGTSGGGISSGGTGGGGRGNSGSGIGTSTPQNPAPVALPEKIYTDIDDAPWAESYILGLTEKGIVNGKESGKFCPNDNITREEFTKLVAAAFLNDAQPADIAFSDVEPGEWYCDYIKKAYGAGVVKGMPDGTFGIGMNITRQDMAVIACRAAGIEFKDGELGFDDSETVSDYAKGAVAALSSMDIINGTDGKFMPLENATRAQAAKIIYMLMQQN